MKAKILTFVRGLKNGTPPRFQSYLKTLTLLFGLMLSVNMWGEITSPWTYNFTGSESLNNGSMATGNDVTWTVSATAAGTSSDQATITIGNVTYDKTQKKAIKFGTSGTKYYSPITFTTSAFSDKKVSKITIGFALNGKQNTTLSVSQGSGANKVDIGSYTYTGDAQKWKTMYVQAATGNEGKGGDLSFTITTAQAIAINSIKVEFTDMPAPSKTLSSIAVTTDPKKEYTTCEKLDLSGCVVTATYSDDSKEDVTSKCIFSPENGATLTTDVTSVLVSYGGKETTITGISVTKGDSDTYVDNVHNSEISGDFSCSYQAPPLEDKQKGATESCEDTHYHFVGWVEEGTTPIQSPSNVIPAGTDMTGSNKTYKAVWAKEAEE